jgi:hypothetical protein
MHSILLKSHDTLHIFPLQDPGLQLKQVRSEKQILIYRKINSPKIGDGKDFLLFQKKTKLVRRRYEFQRSLFFKQRFLEKNTLIVS